MSIEEEEEDDEFAELTTFIEKCSDVTLILNKISPLVEGIKSKKTRLVIDVMIQSIMKVANDFRSLLKYMNLMKELNLDTADMPTFESVDNDSLYA
jgi:KaiC/GvpD/RAD55 family RecA-like ATPase